MSTCLSYANPSSSALQPTESWSGALTVALPPPHPSPKVSGSMDEARCLLKRLPPLLPATRKSVSSTVVFTSFPSLWYRVACTSRALTELCLVPPTLPSLKTQPYAAWKHAPHLTWWIGGHWRSASDDERSSNCRYLSISPDLFGQFQIKRLRNFQSAIMNYGKLSSRDLFISS